MSVVPKRWKHSEIVPVPKKACVVTMNDLRPVALTSAIMKVCEKIVLDRLTVLVSDFIDPLQFVYQRNRGTEDAIIYVLNSAYRHLEKPGSSIRMMFYDFSSAFNTIQPHLLVNKMKNMHLPSSFIAWIFSYLTNRPQHVRLPVTSSPASTSSHAFVVSDTLYTNTGAPQGTVLSPFLFTLYTADGRQTDDSCPLVKFADDTSQVGMISNGDDSVFRSEVSKFVSWCEENHLELNTSKTRELIVDFSRNRSNIPLPIRIKGEEVKQVNTHKYLGIVFDNKLNFSDYVDEMLKKIQPRIYCLRKLRSFNVQRCILERFYNAAISSILVYGSVCWGGNISKRDWERIEKVIKKTEKVTGGHHDSFDILYHIRLTNKTARILSDDSHPLWTEFNDRRIDRSGRLRVPTARTQRYRDSFLPSAVRAYNDGHVRSAEG